MTEVETAGPSDPGRRRLLGWALGAGAAAGLGYGAGVWRGGPTSITGPVAPTTPTSGSTTTAPIVRVLEPSPPSAEAGDRILVVLQMTGGNDGLNTLVPSDDGRYHDARPTIGLRDGLVELAGEPGLGLHPALAPLAGLWADGYLALVASAGMPDQTRSHFTSLDSWWRASTDTTVTDGWLGRWLAATGGDGSPLRAVALGAGGGALRAPGVAATVIQDPTRVDIRQAAGVDSALVSRAVADLAEPSPADPAMVAVARASLGDSIEATELIADLMAEAAPPLPGAGLATTLLDTTAELLERELGTRVVVVGIGGFDTHADQPARHQALLSDVATGIERFFERLGGTGLAERTLLVGMSEFGRRVAENGSDGTDHGRAGLQLLAGRGVNGGVVAPWALGSLDDGDLPILVDARSVYAAGLDWLGGPTAEVLGGDIDDLDLIRI